MSVMSWSFKNMSRHFLGFHYQPYVFVFRILYFSGGLFAMRNNRNIFLYFSIFLIFFCMQLTVFHNHWLPGTKALTAPHPLSLPPLRSILSLVIKSRLQPTLGGVSTRKVLLTFNEATLIAFCLPLKVLSGPNRFEYSSKHRSGIAL